MATTRPLALITGGTSGIGFGIAQELSDEYDLALVYKNNHKKAEASVSKLNELCSSELRVKAFAIALQDYNDCQHLLENVQNHFEKSPDVLVNSAGVIDDQLYMGSSFETHVQIIQQHLLTTMGLCHLVIPHMYRSRFGRIINLSSISSHYAKRGQTSYAAAKAGIEGFTKTLALEVAHRNVTVNAIAPGLIETPMTEHLFGDHESVGEVRKNMRKKIPAGFPGQPKDVACLTKFLCSPDARYMTGSIFKVDGGRSLGDPYS